MNMKLITGSALTGLVLAGGIAGMVAAQDTATAEPSVSEAQAIEIALQSVPGDVTEIELETEDGQQIYEVEIAAADGSESEVEISADSGEVLRVKAEDDHDDKKGCEKDDDDDDGDDA